MKHMSITELVSKADYEDMRSHYERACSTRDELRAERDQLKAELEEYEAHITPEIRHAERSLRTLLDAVEQHRAIRGPLASDDKALYAVAKKIRRGETGGDEG